MADESLYEEMKRYVRTGQDDARLLRGLREFARPHFKRIANEFYERIREHEDAHAVFTGEAQIRRLQASLQRWLERLLSGPYDEGYFAETMKIGRAHVVVGLPQRYMFTAMALIRVALLELADKHMGSEAPAVRGALCRILDLELAVMLESYRENYIGRIQHAERLKMQELSRSLERTEHRYRNAVELARVAIVGLDREGKVSLFNHEAERMTGFARDEVMGRDYVSTLFADDMQPEVRQVVVRLLASGSAASEVLASTMRTRAGRERRVHWQLAYSPSGTTDEEVVLFAIGRDVTDEMALAERTRQAERLAAVGTLAAGLAHEIRNPLNGAQLHVAFLERTLKRSGAQTDMIEAVHVVADEIRRLANLVTEFLDFARPRPLDLKPIGITALWSRVEQLVRPQAELARVTLHADLPSRDLVFRGDRAKLEQVLLNLVQNAIEAVAPGGGGNVWVRAARTPRTVVLEVEDDGPGLPSSDAPIFDAFYSTKPKGTGLGLAVTHRIITDHQGTIDVESAPGKTLFRVTLPLESPSTSANQTEQRS